MKIKKFYTDNPDDLELKVELIQILNEIEVEAGRPFGMSDIKRHQICKCFLIENTKSNYFSFYFSLPVGLNHISSNNIILYHRNNNLKELIYEEN